MKSEYKGKVMELGSVAYGSSGKWELSLDTTFTEPKVWYATILTPLLELRFTIPGSEIVKQLLKFFTQTRQKKTFKEIEVGSCLGRSVTIVKDDKFEDRYYIKILNSESAIILTLWDPEIENLMLILSQVIEEMAGV